MDPKTELPRVSDKLGIKAGPFEEHISPARIEAFYRALGLKPRPEAPPSFMTVCRKGEFQLFDQIGVPLDRVLHAEQEYSLDEPIQGGDTLRYETELVQALEKRGSKGQMLFLSVETRVAIERAGRQFTAGSTRSTVVVK